jgi:hypothetical protein
MIEGHLLGHGGTDAPVTKAFASPLPDLAPHLDHANTVNDRQHRFDGQLLVDAKVGGGILACSSLA